MSGRGGTTILVTGVGDTVGQALVKAARQMALPCRIIGTDRDKFSVGLRWVDAGFIVPHCSSPDAYLAEIRRICVDEGVQLVLPGSEKELQVLFDLQNASPSKDATSIPATFLRVTVAV